MGGWPLISFAFTLFLNTLPRGPIDLKSFPMVSTLPGLGNKIVPKHFFTKMHNYFGFHCFCFDRFLLNPPPRTFRITFRQSARGTARETAMGLQGGIQDENWKPTIFCAAYTQTLQITQPKNCQAQAPNPLAPKPKIPKPRGLGLTLKSHGPAPHSHLHTTT